MSAHDLIVYAAITGVEPIIDPSLKTDAVRLTLPKLLGLDDTPTGPGRHRAERAVTPPFVQRRTWSPAALCGELRRSVCDRVSRQASRPHIADFIRRLTDNAARPAGNARRYVPSRVRDDVPQDRAA